MNDFKGYSLFNDIEDSALRIRNRAVIMTNIVEGNYRNGKITPKGVALVIGYFDLVPLHERKQVETAFRENLKGRGFVSAV